MKKLFLALVLLSTTIFAQTVKVSTLSGTNDPKIAIYNTQINDGAGQVSIFNYPLGVAVSSRGICYSFDSYLNVVRRSETDGYTSTYAGVGTFTSPSFAYGYKDGPAPTALFSNITAICVDAQENVYVMDYNRLRKITPAGMVSTITSLQFEFRNAQGMCVDALGNIYVVDTGNKRIRKVTPSGTITTIATGFTNPKGIALTAAGDLLVCDNDKVKKVTQSGTVSTYAVGFGTASGIAINSAGIIYVSDSLYSVVNKIENGLVSIHAGVSGFSAFRDGSVNSLKPATFYNPEGIAIYPDGSIAVADYNSQRIRKITN